MRLNVLFSLFALTISLLIHAGLLLGGYYLMNETPTRPSIASEKPLLLELNSLVAAKETPPSHLENEFKNTSNNSLSSDKPLNNAKTLTKPEPQQTEKPAESRKKITQPKQTKPKQLKQKKVITKKTRVKKKSSANNTKSSAQKNTQTKPPKSQSQSKQKKRIVVKKPKKPQKKTNTTDFSAYRSGLVAAIQKKRYYPKQAIRMRKQGTVTVRFHLNRDGRISGIRLAASSGSSILDKAALGAVKRLGKYKKPPLNYPTVIKVPIRFRLR